VPSQARILRFGRSQIGSVEAVVVRSCGLQQARRALALAIVANTRLLRSAVAELDDCSRPRAYRVSDFSPSLMVLMSGLSWKL
jgi:hypothetical protein